MTLTESLLVGLLSLDNGNGQQVLVDIGVPVKDLKHLGASCILAKVGSVALLPQELSSTEEGSRVLELPSATS
jgi:hypothetical protein